MNLKKKKFNYTDSFIQVREYKVPLRIYVERRSTIRISVGKDNVLLRIPIFLSGKLEEHIGTAKEWLNGLCEAQPELLEKYHVSKYSYKSELVVLSKDKYDIKIHESESINEGIIKIEGNILKLFLPNNLDEFDKRIMARNLISKLLAKKYKKFVEERIKYWNETYFKKEIKSITLRYNSTNWGSCSTASKINISTRSLLLPLEIFDYILVHELSHFVEMNHSDRFWKVVENVMPKYKNAEKWIVENSAKLDF